MSMNAREERMCARVNEVLSKLPRLDAKVSHVKMGHTYYRCYLQVAPSMREAKIRTHAEFLARELRLDALPTIQTIYAEGAIVIDIPNVERERVDLMKCLLSRPYQDLVKKAVGLPYVIGVDNSGNEICGNLVNDPHILIAGQSGSGKSNVARCIVNSILSSWRVFQSNCRFIYIDPKGVEFVHYKNLPSTAHYTHQTREAVDILDGLIEMMEQRYDEFTDVTETTNHEIYTIEDYSKYCHQVVGRAEDVYPYYVVVIDELADLFACEEDAEKKVLRLIQKARASGIHLIVSTQRPDAETISGTIRANLPTKICCKVSQQIDGRVVFGDNDHGAHRLLGCGDLLYLNAERTIPLRLQGAFSDPSFLKSYIKSIEALTKKRVEIISFNQDEQDSINDVSVLQSPFFRAAQVYHGVSYG
jgi:S-DNA-T family DNA segregation ATPase FtsK/SpoIIIE